MINIIHQTSKTENLKDYQIKSKNSIIQTNPNLKYMFWSDLSLEKLVKDNFKDLYEVWDLLKGIQKADLGRYAVLYMYGGFYADTDIYSKTSFFVKDLNKLNLAPALRVFPWEEDTATNFFMYTYKNNNSLLKLIDEGIKRVNKGYTNVPYTTGRLLIIQTLEKNVDYVVYSDYEVFNKFCYNSDIPEESFAYHDGSTCRGQDSWLEEYKLKLVESDCYLKKSLHMNERSSQFPILTVSIILTSIILSFVLSIIIYKKYN